MLTQMLGHGLSPSIHSLISARGQPRIMLERHIHRCPHMCLHICPYRCPYRCPHICPHMCLHICHIDAYTYAHIDAHTCAHIGAHIDAHKCVHTGANNGDCVDAHKVFCAAIAALQLHGWPVNNIPPYGRHVCSSIVIQARITTSCLHLLIHLNIPTSCFLPMVTSNNEIPNPRR